MPAISCGGSFRSSFHGHPHSSLKFRLHFFLQNWNICDGKCATGIFKTFGGKFPTPLFQTEKVRNFFSLMWKKSDENLLIYKIWKIFFIVEDLRRWISVCWKMCDGHK